MYVFIYVYLLYIYICVYTSLHYTHCFSAKVFSEQHHHEGWVTSSILGVVLRTDLKYKNLNREPLNPKRKNLQNPKPYIHARHQHRFAHDSTLIVVGIITRIVVGWLLRKLALDLNMLIWGSTLLELLSVALLVLEFTTYKLLISYGILGGTSSSRI